MSTQPMPPVVTQPSLDWNKAKAKLDNLCKEAAAFAGKDNHNPFIWEGEVITPLRNGMNEEVTKTTELYNKIMSLPDHPDTRVDKELKDVVRDIPAAFKNNASAAQNNKK